MLKKIYRFTQFAIKTSSEDDITVYSAYAAFYVVISAIPFLMMIFFAVARFVNVDARDIIEILGAKLPKNALALIEHILDEIISTAPSAKLSIPVITLLWTASRSIVALEKGLDRVYKIRIKRGFFVLNFNGLMYTFLLLVILLFSLVLLVFGNMIAQILIDAFPYAIGVINTVFSFRMIISTVVLFMFFAILYTFIPGRKLKLKNQIPGAAFSAVGWILFTWLFSIYMDNFSKQSYLYGSLTAIIVLMLWIYFCMIILFIGGELNYYIERERSA